MVFCFNPKQQQQLSCPVALMQWHLPSAMPKKSPKINNNPRPLVLAEVVFWVCHTQKVLKTKNTPSSGFSGFQLSVRP